MRVQDVSNPRPSGLWVSDHAEMIDPETEARLNELLEKAHKDLTVEITIVTVETVDLPTPKDFATALFEHWGVGHEWVDNGLLILMVKDARRLEMETGYGLEAVLTDGWLKRMQEAEMVPHFRQGNFGQGLFRGAELTVEKVSTERHAVKATDEPPPQEVWFGVPRDNIVGRVILFSVPIALVGFFMFIFYNIIFGSRRKFSKDSLSSFADTSSHVPVCPKCEEDMVMLSEEDEDAHLSPGQIKEEEVGSVDWQYWFCAPCQTSRLMSVKGKATELSKCSACDHRTARLTSRVVKMASYTEKGTNEVTAKCEHCGHQDVFSRTTPKWATEMSMPSTENRSDFGHQWPKPSSGFLSSNDEKSDHDDSSNPSGGSFGGGKSGGGGAGSSW